MVLCFATVNHRNRPFRKQMLTLMISKGQVCGLWFFFILSVSVFQGLLIVFIQYDLQQPKRSLEYSRSPNIYSKRIFKDRKWFQEPSRILCFLQQYQQSFAKIFVRLLSASKICLKSSMILQRSLSFNISVKSLNIFYKTFRIPQRSNMVGT